MRASWSSSSAESHPHPPHTAQSPGLLQPAVCVCVCWGNSCPRGRATAEDEGGIRRDSCRHSITTDDRTAQLNQHTGLSPLHVHIHFPLHTSSSQHPHPSTLYSSTIGIFVIITLFSYYCMCNVIKNKLPCEKYLKLT